MSVTATDFIDALHRLEADRDAGPISKLFAPDAAISNPFVTLDGQTGAREFWDTYRKSFDDIRSEFSNVLETDGVIALEWTSTGSAKGEGFRYEGVSILETGDKGVSAFRTYFDSAKLGRELSGRKG